jgi:hypothetical protein
LSLDPHPATPAAATTVTAASAIAAFVLRTIGHLLLGTMIGTGFRGDHDGFLNGPPAAAVRRDVGSLAPVTITRRRD